LENRKDRHSVHEDFHLDLVVQFAQRNQFRYIHLYFKKQTQFEVQPSKCTKRKSTTVLIIDSNTKRIRVNESSSDQDNPSSSDLEESSSSDEPGPEESSSSGEPGPEDSSSSEDSSIGVNTWLDDLVEKAGYYQYSGRSKTECLVEQLISILALGEFNGEEPLQHWRHNPVLRFHLIEYFIEYYGTMTDAFGDFKMLTNLSAQSF